MSLARMVADHFTLLKVGPCLTNAFREAVFALEEIEAELSEIQAGCRSRPICAGSWSS